MAIQQWIVCELQLDKKQNLSHVYIEETKINMPGSASEVQNAEEEGVEVYLAIKSQRVCWKRIKLNKVSCMIKLN